MGRGVEVAPMVLQNRWRMQRWGGLHKAAGQQRRSSCPGGSDCMAEVSDQGNLCCSVTANLGAHGAHLIYPRSSLHTHLEASWHVYRKKAEATPLQRINAKKCHPLAPSSILLYSWRRSCCPSHDFYRLWSNPLETPHFCVKSSWSWA